MRGSVTIEYTAAMEQIVLQTDVIAERFVQGVNLWAEATMTLAKAVYVPVDSGVLRASGYVTEAIPHPQGWVIELGFGGAAAKYAYVVHERPPHMGQGKNKYLYKAVRDRAKTMQSEIAAYMAGVQ